MSVGISMVTAVIAIGTLTEGQMMNQYDQFPQTGIGQSGPFNWYDPGEPLPYWNPLPYQPGPSWRRQNPQTTTTSLPPMQPVVLPRDRGSIRPWLNTGPILPLQEPPPLQNMPVGHPPYINPFVPRRQQNLPIQTTPATRQLAPAPLLPETFILQNGRPSRYPANQHPHGHTGNQPLLPGNRPLLAGTPHPFITGNHPLLPGNRPLLPGNYPLIPGNQPLLPGNQALLPGNQPLLPANQPVLPANQPPLPGNRPLLPGNQPLPPENQINQQQVMSQMMNQLRQLLSTWFNQLSNPAAAQSQPSWRSSFPTGPLPPVTTPPEFLTINFTHYGPKDQSIETFQMRTSYMEQICNQPTVSPPSINPQSLNPWGMPGMFMMPETPPVTTASTAEPLSCGCMDFIECESRNNVYFNKKTATECAGHITGFLCCCEEPRLPPVVGK